MEILSRLVNTFIMSFGITQPKPAHRKTAYLLVGLMLLAVATGFLALIYILVTRFFT